MIYLLGAMALVAALSGLWGGWEHNRAGKFEAQVSELNTKIEAQNAAIQQTKAEGDRRVAEATKGVARAIQTTRAAQTEAERLRSLQGAATPAGNCPAGSAVAELRKGLK